MQNITSGQSNLTKGRIAAAPSPPPPQLFYRDHPGEPVPEKNFWNLDFMVQGKINRGRHTKSPTIRLGATQSRLTSANHQPPP